MEVFAIVAVNKIGTPGYAPLLETVILTDGFAGGIMLGLAGFEVAWLLTRHGLSLLVMVQVTWSV